MSYLCVCQRDDSENIAACLAMIAKKSKLRLSDECLSSIAEECAGEDAVLSFAKAAEKIGLFARVFTGKGRSLGEGVPTPFVAELIEDEKRRLVVVYLCDGGKAIIADPASGLATISASALAERWTGRAVIAEKENAGELGAAWVLRNRSTCVSAFTGAAVLGLCTAALPFAVGRMLAAANSFGMEKTLISIGLLAFAILAVAAVFALLLRDTALRRAGALTRELLFRENLGSGREELSVTGRESTIRSAARTVMLCRHAERLAKSAVYAPAAACCCVVALVVMMIGSWRTGLVAVAALAAAGLSAAVLMRGLRTDSVAVSGYGELAAARIVINSLEAERAAHIAGADESFMYEKEKLCVAIARSPRECGTAQAKLTAAALSAAALGLAVVFFIGARQISADIIDTTEYIPQIILYIIATAPVFALFGLERLLEATHIVGGLKRPRSRSAEQTALPEGYALAAKELEYTPDGHSYIIDKLTAEFAEGSRVAIYSPVGADAHALLLLLSGELEPNRGEVDLSGTAILSLSADDRRRAVAYIPETPFIMSGSVMDNLLLGCGEADKSAAAAICADTGADGFIKTLPRGYDTPIGEAGVPLSRLERLLIAISRALTGGARALLLDCAADALDSQETKELLSRLGKTTVILATGRRETAFTADSAYTIENGGLSPLKPKEGREEYV